VPDDLDAATRARQLWEEGLRSEILTLLKQRVREEPTDRACRLVLAELYRELVAPDQAGRWGIAFPAWTTDVERDRLARMIAHSGIADDEIPAFLALPPADPSEPGSEPELPDEAAALLPEIERYRAHFADPARMTRWERKAARQAAEQAERAAMWPSGAMEAVGMATDFSWWMVGAVFALGAGLVWLAALFDQPVTALARWTGTATLGTMAVACAARAFVMRADERFRRRREPDSDPVDVDVSRWLIGAIMLGLIVYGLVSANLRTVGPLPF